MGRSAAVVGLLLSLLALVIIAGPGRVAAQVAPQFVQQLVGLGRVVVGVGFLKRPGHVVCRHGPREDL